MAEAVAEQIDPKRSREKIVTTGLAAIEDTISRISRSACSVLIVGETGTGKEIIARRIHEKSDRNGKPFVAVNIGGVNADLLGSELFGHARGAYTSAHIQRDGKFAKAEGGTIFLDEIGELEVSSQVKLLRVLQDRKYYPLGSDRSRNTDARVIAATNADVPKAVREKRLREDLLHRFPLRIKIPSLRERGAEAISTLAENFVFTFSAGKKALSKNAMSWLCSKEQRWPGNVRQLESVLEMACLLAPKEEISLGDLIQFYHDDHKLSRLEESLNALNEGDGNDGIIDLARRIYREGGIRQFRKNFMANIFDNLKVPGQFVEESNSNDRGEAPVEPQSTSDNAAGVKFHGDKEEFSEGRLQSTMVFEFYPEKAGVRLVPKNKV
jgi:transcriptional regulator with GAF, ATPase, and Fis domain